MGLKLCRQASDYLSVGVQVAGVLGPEGNMTHGPPWGPKLEQNPAARGLKMSCVANRLSAPRVRLFSDTRIL